MTPSPALGIAAAAALAAAAMHAFMFVTESVRFGRAGTLRMLEVDPEHAGAVRLWAFHQGVYNLLLGATAAVGALLLVLGPTVVGRTLVVAAAASMIAAAVALLAVDRRRQRVPGFLAQVLPPVVALVALLTG